MTHSAKWLAGLAVSAALCLVPAGMASAKDGCASEYEFGDWDIDIETDQSGSTVEAMDGIYYSWAESLSGPRGKVSGSLSPENIFIRWRIHTDFDTGENTYSLLLEAGYDGKQGRKGSYTDYVKQRIRKVSQTVTVGSTVVDIDDRNHWYYSSDVDEWHDDGTLEFNALRMDEDTFWALVGGIERGQPMVWSVVGKDDPSAQMTFSTDLMTNTGAMLKAATAMFKEEKRKSDAGQCDVEYYDEW